MKKMLIVTLMAVALSLSGCAPSKDAGEGKKSSFNLIDNIDDLKDKKLKDSEQSSDEDTSSQSNESTTKEQSITNDNSESNKNNQSNASTSNKQTNSNNSTTNTSGSSSETTKPQESVKPQEPAKPQEPVKPQEPTKPQEPVKPQEPTKPQEPIEYKVGNSGLLFNSYNEANNEAIRAKKESRKDPTKYISNYLIFSAGGDKYSIDYEYSYWK